MLHQKIPGLFLVYPGISVFKIIKQKFELLFLIRLRNLTKKKFYPMDKIPTPSLDIITIIIRHLFTLIYFTHMLVHHPEPFWLAQSSIPCVFSYF